MIGEIRQNFTEASASVGLILATALAYMYIQGDTFSLKLFNLLNIDTLLIQTLS